MSPVESAEQRGLHALYRDHHGWLQNWLRKKLNNTVEAADLAQDTFVRVLGAWRKQGDLQLREPRAYLTSVAGRVLLNHWRRLSLEQAYLEALAGQPEALSPSPEARLLVLEALHEIDALLDTLSPKVRTAFLYAQLEGLTYAEIAVRLGVSERTIKRYIATAYEECLLAMA